jgi:hypothetical protein
VVILKGLDWWLFFYFILFYFILFYFILFYFILFYFILFYFIFTVYDATDYWKYFLTEWLGIHCVTTDEISEVGIIFVCISWNIWSRNYFCLLYTFSGCSLVLLNWAILQRRLLYANQVCCTVCSHKSLAYLVFFLFWRAACDFPLYELYYSFLWLWLYVCSSLLFVAVLVAMQKMHVEIECVYWINRLL